MKKMLKINNYFSFFLFLFSVITVSSLVYTEKVYAAADLVISPLSGVIVSNTSFSVDVFISNNTQSVNAVSGSLSFPASLLQVSSISKDGTIVKFWSVEPEYSNTEGTIHFEGVMLNPGFSGTRGKIMTINFSSKRSGKANILFTSGSVLANDGQGSNVLGILGSASFTLSTTATVSSGSTTTSVENPLVPLAPKILSSTHSDPAKWYNNSEPSFSWTVSSDIQAVRILYDKNPSSVPTQLYSTPIFQKTLKAVPDGSYYFHVQLKNAYGWGSITHFRFQIDTAPPAIFSIKFPHGLKGTNPQPIIYFNTSDELSGIDHYEIKIGDEELQQVAPMALSNPYAVPPQPPGERTVVVRAIDKAGNTTTESSDFTIDAIRSPVITFYPETLTQGDILKIRGTTYPDATVMVFLKNRRGVITSDQTKSNSSGDFGLVWSKALDADVYELSAQTIDNRQAKSPLSSPVTITVEEKALVRIGLLAVNYLSIAIIVIVVIAGLVSLMLYIFSRLIILNHKMKRDIFKAENKIHGDFLLFHKDLEEQVKALIRQKERRMLTSEEISILDTFQKHFSLIDKDVGKAFESIEKDLR